MSNFDVQYPPSPQWQTTQNYLEAPNHSIQMSGLESYQTVIKTESYVKQIWEVNKKNEFETTQQVSSVIKPTIQMPRHKQYLKSNYMIQQQQIQKKEAEITSSSSQLNFDRAGPSKTFISSNAIIGSTTASGNESHYQSKYDSALLVSNEVVVESNELIDFPFTTTPRVDSTNAAALQKNDLSQAANKETLKLNDSTREQSTVGVESIAKHSPSRAGSSDPSNSFNEINKSSAISGDASHIKLQSSQSTDIPADIKNALTTFGDIIPEKIHSGLEYQLQLLPIQFTDTQSSLSKEHKAWNELLLQTSTSELNSLTNLSPPLTAQSFNLDEKSNEPIIFAVGNDAVLDYPEMQGVEYEVTLLADQPHYQTVQIAEIESSTLGIEPVKTYITTNANNKVIIDSNVLIEPPKKSLVKSTYAGALPKNPRKSSNPKTSKAGPMIGSNRLSLQSKVPNARTTESNVDMKSNGSIQQPTFDTKSTSLKRKLKENILPIVPSKKPSLQYPKEPQIIVGDKTFSLTNISIQRVQIVGGIEKRQTLRELTLDAPSEPNTNKMTFSDCMDTLLKNNIHVFKVPTMKSTNVLNKYLKTLEKNNVRVTKIKK